MNTVKKCKRLRSLLSAAVFLFILQVNQGLHAGTGYIDSDGKLHFSVAFYYQTTPPSDLATIQDEWRVIFELADIMLYKATGGRHQFGEVKYFAGSFYDPTVDIVIGLDSMDDPTANVYGINRLGYHIFMSEQWRKGGGGLSNDTVARILIHEMGHYLYSLFDEYRSELDAATLRHCIPAMMAPSYPLSDKACFMEQFDATHKTWCHLGNHDKDPGNVPNFDTWQSEATGNQSCWSIMKRIYENDHFQNALPIPADPDLVDATGVSMTWMEIVPHVELLIAVSAEIYDTAVFSSKMSQMLSRAFASFPTGAIQGRVAFIVYSGNDIKSTLNLPVGSNSTVQWSNTLVTDYPAHLLAVKSIVSPSANIDFNNLLTVGMNVFNQLSADGDIDPTIGGTPRTFLFLTLGNDMPTALTSSMAQNFKNKNIRTSIGFFQNLTSVPLQYIDFAEQIDAAYYDIASPEVLAYQAIDAANKQGVRFETETLSANEEHIFRVGVAGEISSSLVSISWSNVNCDLPVTINVNGQGGPILQNNEQDFIAPGLKGRRLFGLVEGDSIDVIIGSVPEFCVPAGALLTISMAISDEQPVYFFTAGPERFLYGTNDFHNVHARVICESYPVRNLDTFDVGEVDAFGNFLQPGLGRAFDGGLNIESGDWVADDGIYANNITSLAFSPGFHTTKFIAENKGAGEFVLGENLFPPKSAIPKSRQQQPLNFRREGFATYYVDLVLPTTLPVFLGPITVDRLDASGDSRTLAIHAKFSLPKNYPHARFVTATWGTDILDVIANEVQDTIVVDKNKQDSLAINVVFRTADSRSTKSILTSVEQHFEQDENAPGTFHLYPNYPNPFNASTKIAFYLPREQIVSLVIYDLMGRKIRILLQDKVMKQGLHEIAWDGHSDANRLAGSGVYLIKFSGNDFTQVQKAILLK